MSDQPFLDPKAFWGAIGCRAVGVAIVTAEGEAGPSGFLALSATHLAASPPTMMVSVSLTTSAYADIVASGHFAINYLASDAGDVYAAFAGRDAPKGAARFDGVAWHPGVSGAPVFDAIVGVLECKVLEIVERYGTAIVIGEIVGAARNDGARPMIHFGGKVLS
jgi:flavin reductase (DIM6/NTAB) family NADH-FMN oxidoreductase RutF